MSRAVRGVEAALSIAVECDKRNIVGVIAVRWEDNRDDTLLVVVQLENLFAFESFCAAFVLNQFRTYGNPGVENIEAQGSWNGIELLAFTGLR